ncbi:MAG: Gfo/Idh/MocA family oxidoreductase, partial [Verrucomicrobiota bacterium]|nr:Gfo/Idh/MocA family oxidoreductase [Verrucomicrobiota bacterium]
VRSTVSPPYSFLAVGAGLGEQGDMAKQTSLNRRGFLKGSTGAGLLICSSRVAFGYQANEKLNMACIGVGGQGEGNVRNVSGENVVAVCDVDERRGARMLREHSKARHYKDFRRMLAEMDKQIDAVVVCTPDHTHAVAAVGAMKQGKHVYCEKPLTRTVFEARMMRLTAAKHKVVTQMGNQGSASEGVRRATEWGEAGTAGSIREAYLWVGDGSKTMTRPKDTPPVPKELDWDLWLGPASERPYHPGYLPFIWRGWRHFGSGGLGDMGCHTGNFLFRCLDLGKLWEPVAGGAKDANRIRIEGEATGVHAEGYPASTRVHFHVPARGDLPPVKLTVSSGVEMRPGPELLHGKKADSYGALLIGSKASIYSSNPWNTSSELLSKNKAEIKEPPRTIPRGVGHHREWIEACKGKGEAFSSFAIGGPLTELIQLANIAGIVGEPFHYDPLTGEIPDHPGASSLLHRPYRKEWTL